MSEQIKIHRTCKGKRITAAQVRQDLRAKIDSLSKTDQESPAWPSIEAKIAEKQEALELLEKTHDDTEVGRMHCGYDLNPIIEAIPEDGEVYSAKCPACGNEFTLRRTPPESD